MINIPLDYIQSELCTQLQGNYKVKLLKPVSGGDINQCFKLECEENDFFLKVNDNALLPMFYAEYAALKQILESRILRCPTPLFCGSYQQYSFLLMEFLHFCEAASEASLGTQLAEMHRVSANYFGWPSNNYIGKTPQINTKSQSWCYFWTENRLAFQFKLACKKGYGSLLAPMEQALFSAAKDLLSQHNPVSSLLHGDLWSGNKATILHEGKLEPVIFDPASYFGDRETDLALTELFGGFDHAFYEAYNEAWPIDQAYSDRKPLYQLYHMLNHLNLFGEAYINSCLRLIRTLTS